MGIEAHRAGKVEDASRYYEAILKKEPKHPDANHNMGVLVFGFGNIKKSPFFKMALDANPKLVSFGSVI